jgi:hypothetical protein
MRHLLHFNHRLHPNPTTAHDAPLAHQAAVLPWRRVTNARAGRGRANALSENETEYITNKSRAIYFLYKN